MQLKTCPECKLQVPAKAPQCAWCNYVIDKPAYLAQRSRDHRIGKRIQIGYWVLIGGIVLSISYCIAQPTILTPEEKLERRIKEGQRDVCDKWGDTVAGC